MTSLREKENRSFCKWKRKRPELVRDGVVDESQYRCSKPRIVFVLKEPNQDAGGDLRKFLKETPGRGSFVNVARWLHGIRKLPADISWSRVGDLGEDEQLAELASICAINLKKTPGGSESKDKLLKEVAFEDAEFFRKQFEFYDPQLTICCGQITSEIFHQIVFRDQRIAWKKTHHGICYHGSEKKSYVIKYVHPAARISDSLLYYGIVEAIRELRH